VRDSLVSAAGEYAKSDAEMSAARPTGRQPDRAPATPTAPAAPALVADPRPATPSAASEGARAIGVMPTGATPSAPAAARVSCEEQPAHPRCRFEKALLDLRSVDLLPIGWREAAPDEDGHRALALPKDGWDWTARILGWLLTALAASFGAPFWFDLLNKVTTLRSALKPRDKPAAGT
jgi:hypothetical protein